jgi:RNA polymerase sigma factor (sigma-70 family)
MEAARTPAPISLGRPTGGRLLKLASDDALVRRIRAGNEQAFAVLYERYQRPILAFARHMLGSREEAEDAVQQTFVNAYRALLRDRKDINLRPWLYQIARNHCISALRRRRSEVELSAEEPSLIGLSDQVARRGELRDLLSDLAGLPDDQREALVLAELHDNSHAAVAEILGCEREKVKSLVFQARSSLLKGREARDLSCEEVRRQLATLRGSALRRGAIGRHVRGCEGCRAFGADVRRQRQQLAMLLVVVPSATLKFGAANAAAAAGMKAASGASAAASAASATAASSAGALTAKAGAAAMLTKATATVVAAGVLATGGAIGTQRVRDAVRDEPAAPAATSKGGAASSEAPGGQRGLGPGDEAAPSGAGRGRLQARARHRTRGAGRERSARAKRRSRAKPAGPARRAQGRREKPSARGRVRAAPERTVGQRRQARRVEPTPESTTRPRSKPRRTREPRAPATQTEPLEPAPAPLEPAPEPLP